MLTCRKFRAFAARQEKTNRDACLTAPVSVRFSIARGALKITVQYFLPSRSNREASIRLEDRLPLRSSSGKSNRLRGVPSTASDRTRTAASCIHPEQARRRDSRKDRCREAFSAVGISAPAAQTVPAGGSAPHNATTRESARRTSRIPTYRRFPDPVRKR